MACKHGTVNALLLLAGAPALRAEVNLILAFGIRSERDSDRLPAVALAADAGPSSWTLRPEVGMHIGFNPLYPGYESELSVGMVHYWELSRCRLHLGAGAASLSSKFGYNEGST